MREIIKLKRVSVRNDAEACVTRLMRETWHLCICDIKQTCDGHVKQNKWLLVRSV